MRFETRKARATKCGTGDLAQWCSTTTGTETLTSTSPPASGTPNYLYRNEGDGSFVEVAAAAGVAATGSHSSGAVACDLDNDGYQDLYVGARGAPGKSLDYRSALENDDVARSLRESIKDRLFVNNGDGTFREMTELAFGSAVNIRSTGSVACADVDGDGWLDVYVGNMVTEDYFAYDERSHPGHYNVMYRNNGDLTFDDVTESAGVRGPEIFMLDPEGQPLMFVDSRDRPRHTKAMIHRGSTAGRTAMETRPARPTPSYSSTTTTMATLTCGWPTTATSCTSSATTRPLE